MIIDPWFRPDWLQMPEELGGEQARVEASCWLPVAPNIEADPQDHDSWFVVQRTRWHLLAGKSIAVAEVVGVGWMVLEVGPTQVNIIRSQSEKEVRRDA